MIEVPGGTWLMGTSAADGRDGESPVRQVKVESFQMDKYPVTNEDFSFVFEDFVPEVTRSKITERIEGSFPENDTAEDGFHGVSPVSAFPAQNSYGLYDMLGNTWEWTSTPFRGSQKMFVLRGASFIDTVDGSANHKAGITTRMGNTPDSASDNLSFRCAASTL
uniref:Sulfatase modifying factor 2 n=1 Tax=Neogobius melanostomus TaxID=47308 RepID=A0A8C6TJQ8_9GOBI